MLPKVRSELPSDSDQYIPVNITSFYCLVYFQSVTHTHYRVISPELVLIGPKLKPLHSLPHDLVSTPLNHPVSLEIKGAACQLLTCTSCRHYHAGLYIITKFILSQSQARRNVPEPYRPRLYTQLYTERLGPATAL